MKIEFKYCLLCFECEQSGESFKAVVTPVNKVSHKDVVGVRNRSAGTKELLEGYLRLVQDITVFNRYVLLDSSTM